MSKLKKKPKTQGKNSKFKVKTRKVGTFRIPGYRKSVQKKPALIVFVLEETECIRDRVKRASTEIFQLRNDGAYLKKRRQSRYFLFYLSFLVGLGM